MAKFFVGQRVRITGCINEYMRHHVGKEGRIVRRCPIYPDAWEVDTALFASNGAACSWHSDRLSPITDSYDKLAWTDERCVWKPEHMREEA